MDRCAAVAVIAATEAMADAGLPPGAVAGERLGVVLCSGLGGLASALADYELFLQHGWSRLSPLTVSRLMPNAAAAHVGLEFGATAGVHALVSACASGAEAIGYGIDMIRSGRADVVIAGGAEACLHPMLLAAFAATRALSRYRAAEHASRPFDQARDGFVAGEGAAALVLESQSHAAARGAAAHAVAAGVGYSSDAHDLMRPPPGGGGAAAAMRRSLADADLTPSHITHLNAHGTSTRLGDLAEAAAIKAVFAGHTGQIAVTATKSLTGHLLGAAGALEAAFTVLALRDGLVPPVGNLDAPTVGLGLDLVRGAPQALPAGPAAALTNSFGFGGHNVCLAFTRSGEPAREIRSLR
jgi:3-oxoacyl-[acyl-carrier-protein] synthase II